MAEFESVAACLSSEEPLSLQIARFLVTHREEDAQVDYKLTVDPTSEKSWLELTKDVSAFANTFGGYLVIGVRNNDKKVVGVLDDHAAVLEDANNVLQKLNKYLEPSIEYFRTKVFAIDKLKIVVMYIPQSRGRTHLISKNGPLVLRQASITWRQSTKTRASTPRRNRSTSGPWPLRKRLWGRSTPMWPPASTIWQVCTTSRASTLWRNHSYSGP